MNQPTDDQESRCATPGFDPSTEAIPGLRARAEQALRARADAPLDELSLDDAKRLVQELRVHQIELEIQNEELRRAQAELEESRARYFELYDLAPVGYLTLSEAGLIEEANLAAATLLDRPRAALVGQPLSSFIFHEDQDILYRCCRALRSTHERQRTELALLDAQARLRLVTQIAELTFWEWDPRCDRLSAPSDWTPSPATAASTAPARLAEWAELLHPEDRARILAAIRGFVEHAKGADEIQYRIRDPDSEYRWILTRLEAILDSGGRVDRLLLVHQDVTRRKAAEDDAVRMAQHDPVTGLPGRVLLEQLAKHMIAAARRSGEQLAVLFLDLDRFKAINDLHGHDIGDHLLRAVARRLRATFRAEDLLCRLGGDEFVVVLARIRDAEEAAHVAQKVIARLTSPYDIAGLQLQCAASLGISLFPRDGDTLGQLMQQADRAMYQAKQVSPGRYQFAKEALKRRV
jgi:diguanylate cyclase (GGDEF)-like protein